MLPVIALVGRPNVGKSTLFNRLTKSRDALVADQPGLTRDRQYGLGKIGNAPYLVVDTGGLSGVAEGIDALMERQVMAAIEEADHVFFMVDARDGCNAGDEAIAERLRLTGKPITPVANKSENLSREMAAADFFGLGLGEPLVISAAHGRGIKGMMERVLATLPEASPQQAEEGGIRIAVVGRPNVGKSTLVNRMLGEQRVVAFDQPGTTRDSIFIPFRRDERDYTLIDTAGVRRRARVRESIEKFSVIKTMQAINDANVVLMVIDAQQGMGEQDASLAGHIVESGRALILLVNKWDGLEGSARETVKRELERRLPFLDFAEKRFVSALHGSGVGDLYPLIDKVYANATRDLPTPRLTDILEQAVHEHQPPLVRGRRIKLRYAHQGGRNPPIVVVHGNQTDALPAAYRRYLVNRFRKELDLWGTPLRIELKSGDNPFKGKVNKLSERQIRKRQRLKKFVSRKR
jgi:GTP-binding protein